MENTILCPRKTTNEPLMMSVNQDVSDKNDSITITLKKNEKELTPIIKSGKVYLITNLINNKKYVGITTRSLKYRWKEHVNRPIYRCGALQHSIKKYGEENFKVELIEEQQNISEEELLSKETFYINKYNTFIDNGCGYNLIKENTQQLLYSQSTKQKMSRNRTGRKNQFYGKRHTDKSKSLMSQSHIGISHTMETKKNISLSLTGEKSPLFSKIVRRFKNIHTNEEFLGFQYDFRKKYNIDHASLSSLISGKRKSAKGWILVKA